MEKYHYLHVPLSRTAQASNRARPKSVVYDRNYKYWQVMWTLLGDLLVAPPFSKICNIRDSSQLLLIPAADAEEAYQAIARYNTFLSRGTTVAMGQHSQYSILTCPALRKIDHDELFAPEFLPEPVQLAYNVRRVSSPQLASSLARVGYCGGNNAEVLVVGRTASEKFDVWLALTLERLEEILRASTSQTFQAKYLTGSTELFLTALLYSICRQGGHVLFTALSYGKLLEVLGTTKRIDELLQTTEVLAGVRVISSAIVSFIERFE